MVALLFIVVLLAVLHHLLDFGEVEPEEIGFVVLVIGIQLRLAEGGLNHSVNLEVLAHFHED